MPLVYEVEDEAIAQVVQRGKICLLPWKLDESLYAAAQDSTGNYNGTVLDLNTTGANKSWALGRFGNSLKQITNGRVETGSVPINGSFTLSLWLNPSDVNSSESLIISSGFSEMNLSHSKQGSNGSLLLIYSAMEIIPL